VKDALPPAPPRVLRRVPWREARFASLDFEATGLDLARDTIISFGVVPVGQGQIIIGEAVYEVIEPDVPPSPQSVTVHRLRAKDLAGAPSLAATPAPQVHIGALAGRFLLTWSAPVETAFLAKVFGGAPRRWLRRTIDVRKLVIRWEQLEGREAGPAAYGLAAAALRYRVPVASPHHALDDALVTAELFLILAAHLSRRGYGSVRSLLRETRR